MTYDEYYNMIIRTFKESIKIKDIEIYNKVLQTLLNWYKSNYEQDLIKMFEIKDETSIINITKDIEQVCKLSDFEKIQETYQCNQLNDLNKISKEIFMLVQKMIKNENVNFNKSDYENFSKDLEKLGENFPKIIFNKFEFIRSECFLDLNYLLNKGNVKAYSLRTYDYLNNQNDYKKEEIK